MQLTNDTIQSHTNDKLQRNIQIFVMVLYITTKVQFTYGIITNLISL